MPCIIDPVTDFELGDPHLIPLNGEGMPLPPKSAIDTALSNMILSASGWRTVFAASGNEQDDSPAVRDEHLVLAALMADTFSDYIIERNGKGVCVICSLFRVKVNILRIGNVDGVLGVVACVHVGLRTRTSIIIIYSPRTAAIPFQKCI